jgi:hypothetical protein
MEDGVQASEGWRESSGAASDIHIRRLEDRYWVCSQNSIGYAV